MKIIPYIILILSCFASSSQVHVKGYYRKDGTYVKPHYRSNPDGNPYNNWSYPGNTNPFTGKVASGNPNTYLKNYYKIYPNSNKGSLSYKTYTKCLRYTDYSNIKPNFDYQISSESSDITYGYLRYSHDLVFQILDSNKKHIGYVQKRKRSRYKVFDLEGYEIKKEREVLDVGLVLGIVLIAGAFYGISM